MQEKDRKHCGTVLSDNHEDKQRRKHTKNIYRVEHNEHMEHKHCQDGKIECGYLIGNVCKADKNHPFVVTRQINDALTIVGCQSWNEYLEWNHDRTNQVPELPVKQMGDCGNSETLPGSIEGRHPLPMHILQEGNTVSRGDTRKQVSTGCDLMTQCDICGKQSVAKESDGHNYCEDHHKDWCKCISHARMLLNYKGDDK